jgi:hypothetical protein
LQSKKWGSPFCDPEWNPSFLVGGSLIVDLVLVIAIVVLLVLVDHVAVIVHGGDVVCVFTCGNVGEV